MNDHQAINNLLTDYCLALDAGRIDDCATLFENAEFTFEGFPTAKGIEGVKGMFANLITYEDGTPRTRHLLTNVRIDVADGANASAFLCLCLPRHSGVSRPLRQNRSAFW